MKNITITKKFIEGNLKGITMKETFHSAFCTVKKGQVRKSIITRDKYLVTDIEVKEV